MTQAGGYDRVAVAAKGSPLPRRFKASILKDIVSSFCDQPRNQCQIIDINISRTVEENDEIRSLRGWIEGALNSSSISCVMPPHVSVSCNVRCRTPNRRHVARKPIAGPAVVLARIHQLDRSR